MPKIGRPLLTGVDKERVEAIARDSLSDVFNNSRNLNARIAISCGMNVICPRDRDRDFPSKDLDSYFYSITETIKYQLIHGSGNDDYDFSATSSYPTKEEWKALSSKVSAPAAAVLVAGLARSHPPNVLNSTIYYTPNQLNSFCSFIRPLWSAMLENNCTLFACFLNWLSTVIDHKNKKHASYYAYQVLSVMFHLQQQQQQQQTTNSYLVSSLLRVFEDCVKKEDMEWVVATFLRVFWVRGRRRRKLLPMDQLIRPLQADS